MCRRTYVRLLKPMSLAIGEGDVEKLTQGVMGWKRNALLLIRHSKRIGARAVLRIHPSRRL